jgi:Leucine Rich repeat
MILFNPNVTPSFCCSLTHLDLRYNDQIGINGVYTIVDALCTNPNGCTLKVLELIQVIRKNDSNTEMKMRLAHKFVTLLQQNGTGLNELNLAFNFLGDEFVTILVTGLKDNVMLEKLDLSGNEITNVGAEALANVFYYNRTITELSLLSNRIASHGAVAIACALRYNPVIVKLYMADNQISQDEGILCDLLECNESFKSVWWFGQCGYIPEYEDIAESMHLIVQFNDTIQDVDFCSPWLDDTSFGERTAPKKGLRRRQDIYKWIDHDWMHSNNTNDVKKIGQIM